VRLSAPSLSAATLALALALAACGARQGDPSVCGGPQQCSAEEACIVGRCRPRGARISSEDARRLLLAPRRAAVLAAHGPSGGGSALPEAVVLGGRANGDVVLLLQFAMDFRGGDEVLGAFLVLSPVASAPPPAAPTALELGRIVEPWNPETVSWGRRPRLGPLEKAGMVRALPRLPNRIDVTSVVRAWLRRAPDDHGIALLAAGHDSAGSTYSMGLTEGAGPVLEVYLR
jgi:hypothetical protein